MPKFNSLFIALFLLNTTLFATSKEGNLSINVSGFDNNNGQLIIKLFRKEDNIFGNKLYLQSENKIFQKQGEIIFESLPYGDYSIIAIHDEDNNGIMNHNFIKLPTEKFGFSNSWNFTIFSGKPTFEKTRYIFLATNNRLNIVVK